MNIRPPPHDDLWSLIDAVCSGTADARQVPQLEGRLKADPAARRLFNDYCLMHAEIRFQLSADGAVERARQRIESISAAPVADPSTTRAGVVARQQLRIVKLLLAPLHLLNRPIGASLVTASLFIVSVLGVMALYRMPGPQPPNENPSIPPSAPGVEGQLAARITNGFELQWEDTAAAPTMGQFLPPGQVLRLREGTAELTFLSGAKLVLRGPSEFTLNSSNGGFLKRGFVVARVNGNSRGFQVDTPTAVVVDLGTEFGVKVEPSGPTHIHVMLGVVQVAERPDDGPPPPGIRVAANESLVVRGDGSKPSRGAADPTQFTRAVPRAVDRLAELMRDHLVTHYAFDDSRNIGKNTGNGLPGTPGDGVKLIGGMPSLELAADFGVNDLRFVDVAPDDVATVSRSLPGDSLGATVAAWVKTTCTSERGNIFFAYDAPDDLADTWRDLFLLELEYGGRPNALVRDRGFGLEVNLVHETTIADGQWHHLAMTLTPGVDKTLSLYVDGVLSQSASSPVVDEVVLQRARVGRRYGRVIADDNDFQGGIDEVVVMNRALKPHELRWLYYAGKPVR